ncbi:glycerol-3-phosphate 1-O-acyltransferase PlsY [Oceanivirga salmonicida]|uniref:glycerol-3-phosphate 1-O-acyltransferase PlsY n=1 Tax=Oceanivirga salmonicida TaxID=1769291 RepID=UPI00082C670C|nr:glycerol-3-phosphate 1-O-acyltransferase PlsY [Oceanivirga salmonicida]
MNYIYILLTYLIGSIPFSLIFGKIFKKMDLREYGSGNVGSTNAARVLGYKIGILTLIMDVSKGLIPTYIASKYDTNLAILIGLAAILGHSYSVYLKFNGGKAVATSLGVFLALSPLNVLYAFIVFIVILFVTGYVSVASMISACSISIFMILTNESQNYVYFGIFIALLIVYRHKSNIINLINKEEANFFDKVNKR